MVCHETYKDEKGKWFNPEEVETNDGKRYYLKSDRNKKIVVGPSESMSKSKKYHRPRKYNRELWC